MATVDIITSGRVDLTEYAGKKGYLRGARLDKADRYANHGVAVDFLDMDWNDPDPDKLIRAAKDHRPKYVVAGDYLRDEDNTQRVNDRARQLRDLAENVIVVPKSPGDFQHVPEWCVVGYSVPTEYGGTDIPLREYVSLSNQIHVLGGTPHRQFDVVSQLWLENVCSIDGNSIHKAATIGAKAWHPAVPHWRKVDADDAVERAYRESVDNLHAAHKARGYV
jgi:hypothetical protein